MHWFDFKVNSITILLFEKWHLIELHHIVSEQLIH